VDPRSHYIREISYIFGNLIKLFLTAFSYSSLPKELFFQLMQFREFLSVVDYDLDKVCKVKYRHIESVLYFIVYVCIFAI
jgi:hypothetical protein